MSNLPNFLIIVCYYHILFLTTSSGLDMKLKFFFSFTELILENEDERIWEHVVSNKIYSRKRCF
jgi:hypothetical protein